MIRSPVENPLANNVGVVSMMSLKQEILLPKISFLSTQISSILFAYKLLCFLAFALKMREQYVLI